MTVGVGAADWLAFCPKDDDEKGATEFGDLPNKDPVPTVLPTVVTGRPKSETVVGMVLLIEAVLEIGLVTCPSVG